MDVPNLVTFVSAGKPIFQALTSTNFEVDGQWMLLTTEKIKTTESLYPAIIGPEHQIPILDQGSLFQDVNRKHYSISLDFIQWTA
ncbi:uncharacterized protein LOC107272970 [Cephus cinctus]|uniref:Uncharacterized protein LOC107272970 n=1 Tax=Cephus cinctus TaxID=211228 RepID=A0AAJ7CAT1_CEPCN|nr:uncharacterized protein LOC107272970 [Cephus cinctus]XP_015606181.1 uncharacterized protein LOC107272970 [Cephus cinctus]XP_015606182.1 uncharacterized protein LOC107272970 [Cephus cinctus]XP_024946108.1 uncharacterized protein LOC107272970 [Cephus cinctus]